MSYDSCHTSDKMTVTTSEEILRIISLTDISDNENNNKHCQYIFYKNVSWSWNFCTYYFIVGMLFYWYFS